ncbi:hypothetical protein [Dinghuibacter silviterrae]|uniref:Uncharacterized protein n=1 Tax=Dinghuibacter silviterrae TaxID=1539049 RepID=A0A4V3GKT4_9BACT|nr:hypothetical protein [Dinghuibacter silviterrae]TDW96892.1 hypothetical protein EDB95_4728 [Dinghuibacter silviterrae]
MKRIFCALLLLTALPSFSQFKRIAESAEFHEPEEGVAKLLHLKNGNTVYVHINFKEAGFELKIFDPSHQPVVNKVVTPAYTREGDMGLMAIFEINGDVVMLIQNYSDNKPKLYRIIIDGTTGDIKKEEKLAELEKVGWNERRRINYEGAGPFPGFFARKDQRSDHYAIVTLNNFCSDRSKRMEIVLYGPDHKEISRAFCPAAGPKYEFLDYKDMAVIGGEKVCVLLSAFNANMYGNRKGEMVFATLDSGAQGASAKDLTTEVKEYIDGGCVRYNPVTKKILLVAAGRDRQWPPVSDYDVIAAMIDPFGDPEAGKPISAQRTADGDIKSLFGKAFWRDGLPQNVYVNADGTFTVVYEAVSISTTEGQHYSVSNTTVGDISVVRYTTEGVEQHRQVIPQSYFFRDHLLVPFHQSFEQDKAIELYYGTQFKDFAYLDAKERSYILINDLERNLDATKSVGKVTSIEGVKYCDGFYYPLGDGQTPAPQWLFGPAADSEEHDLAPFPLSDYDRDRDLYITLQLAKKGTSKIAKIVWLQPQ